MSKLTVEQVEKFGLLVDDLGRLIRPNGFGEGVFTVGDIELLRATYTALSERGGEQKPVGYLDWPALTFRFNGTAERIGRMPVNAEPIALFTRPQAGQVTVSEQNPEQHRAVPVAESQALPPEGSDDDVAIIQGRAVPVSENAAQSGIPYVAEIKWDHGTTIEKGFIPEQNAAQEVARRATDSESEISSASEPPAAAPACPDATAEARELANTSNPPQLPPLTDAMYHAVRGSEYTFTTGGADSITGYLDDDCLDEIWDAINTALRVQWQAALRGASHE